MPAWLGRHQHMCGIAAAESNSAHTGVFEALCCGLNASCRVTETLHTYESTQEYMQSMAWHGLYNTQQPVIAALAFMNSTFRQLPGRNGA
jgi:hypothetical protein